jgi:hypothetical protein
MKKLILGIVFIFTVSFAFATNNVSEDFNKAKSVQIENAVNNSVYNPDSVSGICAITVSAYNQDGELVGSRTLYFQSESTYHCALLTAAFRKAIQQK